MGCEMHHVDAPKLLKDRRSRRIGPSRPVRPTDRVKQLLELFRKDLKRGSQGRSGSRDQTRRHDPDDGGFELFDDSCPAALSSNAIRELAYLP